MYVNYGNDICLSISNLLTDKLINIIQIPFKSNTNSETEEYIEL